MRDERRRGAPATGRLQRMWATYRLSKRADEAYVTVCSLRKSSSFEEVADESVQVRFKEVPCMAAIGRRSLLDQLKDCSQDAKTGIIGIFGMAGVGKTTLLNKFHNEFLAKATEHFEVIIYIEVTENYSVEAIQKVIGERLRIASDSKTLKERSTFIYNILSKMSFVLIFDDLWEPLNLELLGIPMPQHGSNSKIILTTRIEQVCDRMDAGRKIKVDCLPREEAWELFQEKVGGALTGLDLEKHRYAEELVMRCGGLPLALVVIGRAMACKQTTEEWRHANNALKVAPWQFLSLATDLLEQLKRSYINLPNETLKKCLLYCTMFPEGFAIPKEWITGYFIGEGFIDDDLYTGMDDLYNKGHDVLGVLRINSLLEKEGDNRIKMHPMIRTMALWIASDSGTKDDKWIIWANADLHESPPARKWRGAERISLMRNKIHELQERPDCPELKTLILQWNPLLRIWDGFFQFMPLLKVLDLSDTFISELPSGMNLLTGLQYLDLSHTKIRSLPKQLGALVNLRLLLLSNMPLETIPVGLIGQLSSLQVLHTDVCYGDFDGSGGTGINFAELESLTKLKALDITIWTFPALKKLWQSRRLALCTRNLYIRECSGLNILELLSSDNWINMKRLKCLSIASCSDLKQVVIDEDQNCSNETKPMVVTISDEPIPSLSHLRTSLIRWYESTNIKLPMPPALQSMALEGLREARIVWKSGCVQYLSSLSIVCCAGLEQLVTYTVEEPSTEVCRIITIFPNLKELYLRDLQNFKSLSTERTTLDFPMLSCLTVIHCPMFNKLKLTANELKEIRCSQEWSDKLEWDDEEHKTSMLPLFKH